MTKRTSDHPGERKAKRDHKPRRQSRLKAVLPVRVSGSDPSGKAYTDLVHTLDVTPTGVRLGAVRRDLEVGDQLILQYRQHRAEFRVVWSTALPNLKERQVGLEAVAQKDLWGFDTEIKSRLQSVPADSIPARSEA